MARHSTRCGMGWAHRQRGRVLPGRTGIACHANHAAAIPNTASHALAGSGLSRGTSIPAMATPMTTCTPSASNSVSRRCQREAARRLAL